MPSIKTSGRGQVNRHTHPKRSLWKRLYVSILLFVLPLLVNIAGAFSGKIRGEGAYLGTGFSFRLVVEGFPAQRGLRKASFGWRAQGKNQPVSLTISFRDLDYAYDVFSGAMTLKDALAARLFTTHGPNDQGVAVTYLFAVILKAFFGWRSAYRR